MLFIAKQEAVNIGLNLYYFNSLCFSKHDICLQQLCRKKAGIVAGLLFFIFFKKDIL